MLKKALSIILLLSMLLLIFSCKGEGNEEISDIGTVAEIDSRYDPELPDRDFEGMTFTFAVRGVEGNAGKWDGTDIVAEFDGDLINETVYTRNLYLKDTYNVNINALFCGETSVYTSGSDMYKFVEKSIASGESEFSAILTSPFDTVGYIVAGFSEDLRYLSHVDFEREWWDQNVMDSLVFGSKIYTATGDLTIVDNKATHAFVFNKKLALELGIEDPYETVKNGEWTLERLISDSKVATADLNGDGQMDKSDRYGLHYWQDAAFTFICSTGNSFGKIDDIGQPKLTLNTERMADMWRTVIDYISNGTTFAKSDSKYWSDDEAALEVMLTNDQVLYGWGSISDIIKLRAYEVDFGIIPAPKYDAEQPEYISSPHGYGNTLLTVPISCKDLESTGFVLEAFSAKSAEILTPAFYEVVLKGRVSQDYQSAEMLDIIFSTKYYDIGYFFMWGDYTNILMDAFNNKNPNFASLYRANESKALADIRKIERVFWGIG